METMNRRRFIRTAALACPLLAAAGRLPAWARPSAVPAGYKVLKDKCDGCGDCVEACPVEAIRLKDGKAVIDAEGCIDCGECVNECPKEAIVETDEAPNREKAPARDEAAPVRVVGLWIIVGTFPDGTSSAPETIRFTGTAASGTVSSAATGEVQGSYKVAGREIEMSLPGGLTAKGRIVSADRMEGDLPGGKWRAERKKDAPART